MGYFGCKISKIAKRGGSALDSLAFGGWGLCPQTPFRFKETLLSLKLPVDADAWQIGRQNETYNLYFLPPFSPPVQKTFPCH